MLSLDQHGGRKLPMISIIILNYNGKKYLDACFDSISKISYPQDRFEVIMIDNCSVDGSVDYAEENYSWVRVVSLRRNYGFTSGNNIGVRLANGEYIVLLNNDVVVDRKWLRELVEVACVYPDSIVTSKALFLHKPDVINNDGSKATFVGRGYCPNAGKKDNDAAHHNSETKLVVQPYGASMLIKKDVYEEIGGFDEDYFTSLEDLDLGLRAWLYGHKVIYAPSSVFYHVAGGTAGKGSRMTNAMVYHTTKNSYMNILKCFDLPHLFLGVIFSLAYYFETSVWLTLKTGKLDGAQLVFKAHIWVLKNVGSIIEKRTKISKMRKLRYSFLFQRDFFASPSEMVRAHINLRGLLERLR